MSHTFYLVAGEASGDILGSRLIQALKQHFPDAEFTGIGGPLMQAEGFSSLYPMERLSVMGIVPILKRLPELLKMRKQLAETIIASKPDCLIGIDAPEFNLGLERMTRQAGIKTVHYVSPSVWAWREKRIFKIVKSVDLMLCLFPFELPIYKAHKLPAVCVGHPLANEIAMTPDQLAARSTLSLEPAQKTIALLPGSRGSEVKFLLPEMVGAARLLTRQHENLLFLLPAANDKRSLQIKSWLASAEGQNLARGIELKVIKGKSREVMTASDLVLLASGTATLEAMLLKRPMVVTYKVSGFSYWVYKKLLKINSFSLPNLLAKQPLVPELMQDECTSENLAEAVSGLLYNGHAKRQVEKFYELHEELKLGGSAKAAEAICQLLVLKPGEQSDDK